MLKKISLLLLVVALAGCASISVPNYIKDNNPYKKKVYGEYNKVLKVATEVVEELGWTIAGTSDPLIFEGSTAAANSGNQQILVFTETRQTPWFLGTKYMKLNVLVRDLGSNKAEVELRYIRINSTFFMKFYGYKRDRLAEKILKNIDENLK